MPYRRLPTTDKARIKAIDAILAKAKNSPAENLALTSYDIEKIKNFKTTFDQVQQQYHFYQQKQARERKELKQLFHKARLYISHFIQVINMSIAREEIKPQARLFYGLEEIDNNLPPLVTEKDILFWGKKVVDGEQERLSKGGSPFYNPSIALVKINVELFSEGYLSQKLITENTARAQKETEAIRVEANLLIKHTWNKIEAYFEEYSDKLKRQHAQEYGIVYVFRSNEKKKLKPEELQSDLLFEF